jgi:hypothetical protein
MTAGAQRGHGRPQQDHVAEGSRADEKNVQRCFPVTTPSGTS